MVFKHKSVICCTSAGRCPFWFSAGRRPRMPAGVRWAGSRGRTAESSSHWEGPPADSGSGPGTAAATRCSAVLTLSWIDLPEVNKFKRFVYSFHQIFWSLHALFSSFLWLLCWVYKAYNIVNIHRNKPFYFLTKAFINNIKSDGLSAMIANDWWWSSSLPLKYTMEKVLMKTDTGQSMKQAIQVMIGTANVPNVKRSLVIRKLLRGLLRWVSPNCSGVLS